MGFRVWVRRRFTASKWRGLTDRNTNIKANIQQTKLDKTEIASQSNK